MTCFNREAYIGEAIISVLSSSFRDFEFIIVDDASTDNSVSVIKQFSEKDSRIKLFVNQDNLGDYPNRNLAASYALGKYIKYVDSDDRIYPETLATMLEGMQQFPSAAIGFCDMKGLKTEQYPVFFSGTDALKKHFFDGGLLLSGPSASIIKRDALLSVGGFSGRRYVSDYEAWLQLCLNNDVVVFQPGLVWLRSHRGQENDVGKLEYYHLNYNLHKSFLKRRDIPFTETEKKGLLHNYKIILSRRIYQRLLKWYGFKKTAEALKKTGEFPGIFFTGLLPIKKFKV